MILVFDGAKIRRICVTGLSLCYTDFAIRIKWRLFVSLGRLGAEEILWVVAAEIDDNLLENDAGILRMERQCVYLARSVERQFYLLFHHTAGNGGVVDAVDVLGLLVEAAVEVDADGLAAIEGYIVDETALIEKVESRLGDDVDFYSGER